jgi:hypothetical protein
VRLERQSNGQERRVAGDAQETDLDFIVRLEWAERTGSGRDGSNGTT